jgi:hypothetical protein
MEHLISDLFRNSLYFSKKHAKEPFGPALNWFSPVPKGSLQEGGVYIKFKKLAFWWKVFVPFDGSNLTGEMCSNCRHTLKKK